MEVLVVLVALAASTMVVVSAATTTTTTMGEVGATTATTKREVEEFRVEEVPVQILLRANTTVRVWSPRQPSSFLLLSALSRTSPVTMWAPAGQAIHSVDSTSPAMLLWATNGSLASFPSSPSLPTSLATSLPSQFRINYHPGVFLTNPHPYQVSVLASGRQYSAAAPVPGWCSGGWPAPGLRIEHTPATITMNFTRGGLPGTPCSQGGLTYEIYHRYLAQSSDRDELQRDFVSAVAEFSSTSSIRRVGRRLRSQGGEEYLLHLASYSPTGSLFAVIVSRQEGNLSVEAVYGLAHSYGCSPAAATGLCPPAHPAALTSALAGLAVFLGLVMAFAGHRLFVTSQFLFGCCLGGLVSGCLTAASSLSYTAALAVCAAAAGATGLLTMLLWLLFGLPLLSVLLPSLLTGALLAATALFLAGGALPALAAPLHYWGLFAALALAVPAATLACTRKASILACAVVGSFTTVLPVDYFLGTHLRYIVINVVRRATVADFNMALILPPLQAGDLLLAGCWAALAAAGLATQVLLERRKAPFPPSALHLVRWRREVGLGEEGERAPLLGEEVAVGVEVATPVVGFILGYSHVTTGQALHPRPGGRRAPRSQGPSPLEDAGGGRAGTE